MSCAFRQCCVEFERYWILTCNWYFSCFSSATKCCFVSPSQGEVEEFCCMHWGQESLLPIDLWKKKKKQLQCALTECAMQTRWVHYNNRSSPGWKQSLQNLWLSFEFFVNAYSTLLWATFGEHLLNMSWIAKMPNLLKWFICYFKLF